MPATIELKLNYKSKNNAIFADPTKISQIILIFIQMHIL